MKDIIPLSLLLTALVSCSETAQPTSIATDSLTTVIPAETQQADSSSVPTLEAGTSAMPDPGDILSPQGTPIQEWRGIPIMPEAIAGQEVNSNNAYSYRASVTAQEVQAFYEEQLTNLGWSQPFESSFGENGGTMTFRKEGSSLAVTVEPVEGTVVVLLVMTLS